MSSGAALCPLHRAQAVITEGSQGPRSERTYPLLDRRRTTIVTASTVATAPAESVRNHRWMQLLFGIICMVMVANLQLGWTPFVDPIDQKYHWGRYAIQWAFTIFVLTQTWLVPLHGYLVDLFGPRTMISCAGALVGAAWVLNSYADSLFLLYVAAVIGGVGVGIVYGGSVGNALKWFPDR